jgi:hypothetical protein
MDSSFSVGGAKVTRSPLQKDYRSGGGVPRRDGGMPAEIQPVRNQDEKQAASCLETELVPHITVRTRIHIRPIVNTPVPRHAGHQLPSHEFEKAITETADFQHAASRLP